MLGEAVRQCVEAAGHEYDTNTQKSLLRVRTHSWFCIRILCALWQTVGSVTVCSVCSVV